MACADAPRGEETFLYFAYGSNMLPRRLRLRAPSAVFVATGTVHGHMLVFDKVSVDGSSKCNIRRSSSRVDRVHGVLFEIDAGDRPALDRAEELGRGYREEIVRVSTDSGARQALTYVALVTDPERAPYDWYKAFVVAGAEANGLPEAYVERLRRVASVRDPDAARRAHNAAVLARTPR